MKNIIIKIVMIINTLFFLTGLSMIDTKCNYQSIVFTLITLFIYLWAFLANKKRIENYLTSN